MFNPFDPFDPFDPFPPDKVLRQDEIFANIVKRELSKKHEYFKTSNPLENMIFTAKDYGVIVLSGRNNFKLYFGADDEIINLVMVFALNHGYDGFCRTFIKNWRENRRI
jgi:hypothetical protein